MSHRTDHSRRAALPRIAMAVVAAAALGSGCADDFERSISPRLLETTTPMIDPGDPEPTTPPPTTERGPFDQGPIRHSTTAVTPTG